MQKGIVTCNISNLYHVETTDGKLLECSARGKLKTNDISPVTGDIVQIEITDNEKNTGVITKIENRKNYIKRPKMSNLSQLVLVVAMKLPKPNLELLDKQLVYTELLKVKPVICLNKIDLEDDKITKKIESIYKKIGYTVLKTNAKSGLGVEKLKCILKNNVTAFSGSSGVGKSTLINGIFQNAITEEGNISNKNKRGKNTTTQVKLYKIDNKSYIADTPGFETLELSEISSVDLCHYFIEFVPYINKCEFIGCSHIKEQNCGIKKAMEEGKIDKERYERYCKIYQEIKQKEENKW